MKEISHKNTLIFTNLFKYLVVLFVFISPIIASAQVTNPQNEGVKDEKVEVKSAKEIAKDLEKERKTTKDVKTITDRINKNKDEYVIQIRAKFLLNADNLSTIATKIDTRISKIEISGEDVSDMNANLDSANESIKKAKALLKTLPAKKSLLDYSEAKKYASTIIEARDNLENAKANLSVIIADLKDLVIDKDDDKN